MNSHDDSLRNDEINRDIARAYRGAADQLGAAPSPAVRAAVLAAAARAVQARPTAVGADGQTPRLTGRPRYRVPLAAAASVLIGTLAVLLAQRTEETMPEQPVLAQTHAPLAGTAAERAAADATALAAEPSAATTAPATESVQRDAKPKIVMPPPAPAPRTEVPPAPAEASSRAARSAAPSPRAGTEERFAHSRDAAPPAPPLPAPAPSAAQSAATPSSPPAVAPATAPADAATEAASERAAADRALNATARRERTATESVRRDDWVTARPVQRSAPLKDEVPAGASALTLPAVPADIAADAARWVARIVQLRAEGLHVQADAELAALRVRHPNAEVPAAALRR